MNVRLGTRLLARACQSLITEENHEVAVGYTLAACSILCTGRKEIIVSPLGRNATSNCLTI